VNPRKSATWLAACVLPVKRSVRVAEALDVGDTAQVILELVDFT
jgi:hypothetical protein